MIREAAPSDDAAVGELLVRAFVGMYAKKLPDVIVGEQRKADLRAVASKRAVAKVWVSQGASGDITGTVALWPPGAEGSEAWLPGAFDLRHLAIDDSARGTGLADALLDVAENFARALQGSAVCLHVRREAIGVARLYAARGYQRAPEGDLDLLPEVFLDAYVLKL